MSDDRGKNSPSLYLQLEDHLSLAAVVEEEEGRQLPVPCQALAGEVEEAAEAC